MSKRDFTCTTDFTKEELLNLLSLAKEVKGNPAKFSNRLKGKSLGMIFEKSSTRTRVSFEVGMQQLGGFALFLSSNDLQLGRGEPISDTAKVLSRYLDCIMARTFWHETIVELSKNATIPIINGLSDLLHPCQAIADYLTILEWAGRTEGLTLAYVGDGNNVAHSLMLAGPCFGVNVRVITPPQYLPNQTITSRSRELADKYRTTIELTSDMEKGLTGADVVYTDVWTSMGFEKEKDERVKILAPYQINDKNFSFANKSAIFLHCLPAHRGEEVTASVIDSNRSWILNQAENRLHAQKALMILLLSGVNNTL